MKIPPLSAVRDEVTAAHCAVGALSDSPVFLL